MEQDLTNLIMENQNLIYSIIHYFEGYKNKDDLFQVGAMGLIKAYKKYDPNMGTKFTTYAYPYILGEMKKLITEDKEIKINREMSRLSTKIEKASILLTQQLMREPYIYELADFLELPERTISEAIQSRGKVQSIDEPINQEGKEITLHDTIGQIEHLSLDTLIALKSELENLTPFERELIERRYINNLTQSETADVLGMSQVQVSRKEQKVLTKLRSRLDTERQVA